MSPAPSVKRNPAARAPWPPRRNKYSAKPTVVDGIKFDSKKEAKRYLELKLLERGRVIDGLELQPEFPFVINGEPVRYQSGRAVSWRADFRYRMIATGEVVVEDIKGFDTAKSKIKIAVAEALYGFRVHVL